MPADPSSDLSPGAARGRRVAQVVYFALLTWIIVSGSVQILGEGLFTHRVSRSAGECRDELASLRTRLASASLFDRVGIAQSGELVAVGAFRSGLGDPHTLANPSEAARAWDMRAMELVDGCPPLESAAADALARLRAADEAMVRIDAREVAPARAAHERAFSALPPLPPGAPHSPGAGDVPSVTIPSPKP